MYFFKEPRDIEYFDGTTEKQKYNELRKQYNTIKLHIKRIVDDIEKTNVLYTKDIETFNRRKNILSELVETKLEINLSWIENMVLEIIKYTEIGYTEFCLTEYIADMLFEITKDKRYIHEQYVDEWHYPHNKYRIIDPKILQMENRIKEL
jgi:hypothetical protein